VIPFGDLPHVVNGFAALPPSEEHHLPIFIYFFFFFFFFGGPHVSKVELSPRLFAVQLPLCSAVGFPSRPISFSETSLPLLVPQAAFARLPLYFGMELLGYYSTDPIHGFLPPQFPLTFATGPKFFPASLMLMSMIVVELPWPVLAFILY